MFSMKKWSSSPKKVKNFPSSVNIHSSSLCLIVTRPFLQSTLCKLEFQFHDSVMCCRRQLSGSECHTVTFSSHPFSHSLLFTVKFHVKWPIQLFQIRAATLIHRLTVRFGGKRARNLVSSGQLVNRSAMASLSPFSPLLLLVSLYLIIRSGNGQTVRDWSIGNNITTNGLPNLPNAIHYPIYVP